MCQVLCQKLIGDSCHASGLLSIIFMLGDSQPYKPLPHECRMQKSTFPAPLAARAETHDLGSANWLHLGWILNQLPVMRRSRHWRSILERGGRYVQTRQASVERLLAGCVARGCRIFSVSGLDSRVAAGTPLRMGSVLWFRCSSGLWGLQSGSVSLPEIKWPFCLNWLQWVSVVCQ